MTTIRIPTSDLHSALERRTGFLIDNRRRRKRPLIQRSVPAYASYPNPKVRTRREEIASRVATSPPISFSPPVASP